MTTREYLDLVEEEVKEWKGFEEDRNNLEIIQVWYCKTLQNHKGLFIVKNKIINGIYPQFIEATYNGDSKELYLDFYEKQFKHIIRLED